MYWLSFLISSFWFLQKESMEDCLEASFAASGCDKGTNSSALSGKPPKNSGIDLRSAALLSMSASAQDLSALDKEREKLDESSPRSVLGDCLRSLECEMDSPNASSSDQNELHPHAASHWRGFFRILKHRSMRRLPTMHPMRVPRSMTKRNSRSVREDPVSSMNPLPSEEANFCYLKPSWKNFTLPELQNATNNFNPDNIIGRGGYAEVYKGCLENGVYIAIKRLTRATSEEKVGDFLAELGIIVHVKHPNTAKLMGYGSEGGMHLVFQLSRHGSLASLLHDGQLDWSTRYKIALGTAKGLHYLHEDCQRRIIHRDIKSSNILLTEDFEPQISDFGLAKWLPKQLSHLTLTKFEGTIGYLAPEYFMHGIVDEKTDVFAFGILLLELITGRRALDNTNSTQQSLQIWAKPLLDKNNIRELVDPSLGEVYDRDEMNRVTFTASLCIQDSSLLRPQMSQVVELLSSEETSLECRKKFQKPHHKRTYSDELTNPAEYSNSRYLNDLVRHRQIALGTSN